MSVILLVAYLLTKIRHFCNVCKIDESFLNPLYVCKLVSWLTSLLISDKYRDISSSGWDIFLKSLGGIPGMFVHYFQIITNFLSISKNVQKNISSRTGVITDNQFSVRRWGNKQTDRHSRNLKLLRISLKNIQRMSPENLRKLAYPELEISKDILISARKWGNEQTDTHTKTSEIIWN